MLSVLPPGRIREAGNMDLQKKKDLIANFLAKCNEYADEQLERYGQQAGPLSSLDALHVHDKIHHWMTYKAFNEYTIAELRTEELDHWFD